MANDDRTEKATPKHRERARKRGQIARSADVGGSLVLAAGLFGVSLLGPRIVLSVANTFRLFIAQAANPAKATTAAGLTGLMNSMASTLASTVGPIAAICLATGLLAGAAQVGFRPHLQALKLDFHRLSPLSGIRNLFGPNILFEALKATTKVAVVALIAGIVLVPGFTRWPRWSASPPVRSVRSWVTKRSKSPSMRRSPIW